MDRSNRASCRAMAHPVMPAPTIAISNVSATVPPRQVDRLSIRLSYGVRTSSAAAMRRTAPQYPSTAGEGRLGSIGDLVCRPWCQKFVSFCNSKQKNWVPDVTDRDVCQAGPPFVLICNSKREKSVLCVTDRDLKSGRDSSVSICNIWGPFWGVDVTDLDEPISQFRMSQSVTVRPVFAELLL